MNLRFVEITDYFAAIYIRPLTSMIVNEYEIRVDIYLQNKRFALHLWRVFSFIVWFIYVLPWGLYHKVRGRNPRGVMELIYGPWTVVKEEKIDWRQEGF